MAKKPTVTTLASGFNSTETLNSNFNNITDAFDNTLSLDGSTPNAMGADLDLNSNNIINATAIMVGGSDVVATTAAALAAAVQAQVDADAAVVASALSETNAANSATASQTSADASQASRLASEVAETNAETAETNAETAAALATTNGAAQVVLATDQVALATTQANLATTNGAAQVVLATDQVALATTQAGLATTNGAAQVTLATTQATNAAGSATTATAQAVIATTKAGEASASATQAAADVASIAAAAGAAVDAANSAAAAAAALDNFDDRYLGPKSSEPTLDNDGDALVSGALYFATTSNAMQVYDGANWIAASASGVASMNLYEYTATAGQTTFTGADDNNNSISFIQGNEIVVFNGIILDPSDYNSTTGTSIVLNVGAALNDLLNVYAFKSFTVADTVSASTGGTFGGNVTVTGTLAATTLTGDGSAITGLPAGYTNTDVATYLAGVGNVVVGGTVDGVDIAARDAILTSTTTTANAALPKAGGTMTGVIAGFESTGIDDNATSTAITIDASENVLANTTSTFVVGNGGFAIKPQTGNGTRVDISNAGEAMLLDGAASGPIIGLYGNGSAVGSIGTGGGRPYFVADNGSNGGGFKVDSTQFYPVDRTGSVSNGVLDLGYAGGRWKDAYLSGGVFLGGTGAANKLEDYEEGNWTPVGNHFNLASVIHATYVKIGKTVTLQCWANGTNGSGSPIGGQITGLPFPSVTYAVGGVNVSTANTAIPRLHCRIHTGSTVLYFMKNNDENVPAQDIDAGHIILSITYETNA